MDLSKAELTKVAEALGHLPVGLSHAATYLRRRKTMTVSDYLDDIDRHMSELPQEAKYRSPVCATFRAALDQAEREAPGAKALIWLAAFFAPDDIPEELFEHDEALYPPELRQLVSKRARLVELLGVLDDLSLIAFKTDSRTFSITVWFRQLPAMRSEKIATRGLKAQ